ncbi:MAG: 16S rRNA (guanine(966)-N(2))-methyltransferase RsmD [Deltaproteobacteria bacterium]|jgi:16S rRNA (guanine966-N2)-methyltransferase|nr:16S rRNA (guanine(966)-N(2))-methyltransferase RsmD [Deltaproteobacteria bacterium]
MRVISGKAKGHKLVAPKSAKVRPALDQVKEAIFNILYDVSSAQVLDLFAGSGSIGIEALSRGAFHAVFVEEWGPAIECIRRNLQHCKLTDGATIMKMPVHLAIKTLNKKDRPFDLIFVDPPYEKDLVNKTLDQLANSVLVDENTMIIVEHHPHEPIDEPKTLILTDSRKYGQTDISFLKRQS